MEYPLKSGIEIMKTQSGRINIEVLISWLTFAAIALSALKVTDLIPSTPA